VWPISIGVPNLTNNIFIDDRDMAKTEFQDGGLRHLEFCKKWDIEPYGNPCMTNIYQCTKFEENIFIYYTDMPQWPLYGKCLSAIQIWCKLVRQLLRYTCLCIYKMAAVRCFGFVLPQFWATHDVPLDGINFPR